MQPLPNYRPLALPLVKSAVKNTFLRNKTMPIDKNKIQHIISVQEGMIDNMLQLFAKDLQEHCQQLQALHSHDAPMADYGRLLHRLIGSASYFAADDLRAALTEAEQLSQQSDRQQLETALERVYLEIERILECELMQRALKKG